MTSWDCNCRQLTIFGFIARQQVAKVFIFAAKQKAFDAMAAISIKENTQNASVNIEVFVLLFKEGDNTIAYCPSLDLTGCGESLQSARQSFTIVLNEYLRYCVENNTLREDLLAHGWVERGKYPTEPQFGDLYKRNQEMKDIVDKRDFEKMSVQVPCFA